MLYVELKSLKMIHNWINCITKRHILLCVIVNLGIKDSYAENDLSDENVKKSQSGGNNLDLSQADMEKLPIHKTERRQSKSCPGTEEEVIYRKYTTKVSGKDVDALIASVVSLVETKYVLSLTNQDKQWIHANVSVRNLLV